MNVIRTALKYYILLHIYIVYIQLILLYQKIYENDDYIY